MWCVLSDRDVEPAQVEELGEELDTAAPGSGPGFQRISDKVASVVASSFPATIRAPSEASMRAARTPFTAVVAERPVPIGTRGETLKAGVGGYLGSVSSPTRTVAVGPARVCGASYARVSKRNRIGRRSWLVGRASSNWTGL